MKKIAIIGTQGIPAKYGGFETLVENIVDKKCSSDIEYTVFCSKKNMYATKDIETYRGAFLKYVPIFEANGIQSIAYDILSLLKCLGKGYDVVLILGVSGCIFLPIFRLLYKGKIIVNIDGLEHRREKWGRFARFFLRSSEVCAIHCADLIIADNLGIKSYVVQRYAIKNVTYIAYGGDQAIRNLSEEQELEILKQYQLQDKKYALSICRIEPENNCKVILKAFAQSGEKLCFIGNWQHSVYGENLYQEFGGYPNIQLIGPTYDLDILYTLRKHAQLYVHGHSAGGTNPSLVEAMHFGIPIAAFDCIYNIMTTHNHALYFGNIEELISITCKKDDYSSIGGELQKIAQKEYTWSNIAAQYEKLYND